MIKIDITHPFQDFTFRANLELPAYGITSIFGPSGSGKTTLLNFISGKMTPKKGFIEINGKIILDTAKKISLPIHQRGIGYVFQDPTLFPHYSVEKNLLYGEKEKNPELFQQIIQLLGIEPLLKKRIAYLSGGEKQRISIGRALLSSPNILLMDEPLSALDQARKEEILSYLELIPEQFKIPILYVTHNVQEAERLSQEFIAVDKGNIALKTIDLL
ncbi:MAG TPA: ATP-binding cassette domain-containing protein [Candidatus Ignatzschineria merdigallinarum]|uniref:ATP-binding cassette domain-containing protein n=1 Tax=Candidatus Ignatzschineria merdigallinarum TaxID=2838621 RepID=A0A9D1Q5H8_9GAMM|nr:ATP-binding cassette domain-containing protein [Candidatus Ignatzschineria merdigallinarum]